MRGGLLRLKHCQPQQRTRMTKLVGPTYHSLSQIQVPDSSGKALSVSSIVPHQSECALVSCTGSRTERSSLLKPVGGVLFETVPFCCDLSHAGFHFRFRNLNLELVIRVTCRCVKP